MEIGLGFEVVEASVVVVISGFLVDLDLTVSSDFNLFFMTLMTSGGLNDVSLGKFSWVDVVDIGDVEEYFCEAVTCATVEV